jgi:hypothetical protein
MHLSSSSPRTFNITLKFQEHFILRLHLQRFYNLVELRLHIYRMSRNCCGVASTKHDQSSILGVTVG